MLPVPKTLCSGGRVALAPEGKRHTHTHRDVSTKRNDDVSTQLEVVTQTLDPLIESTG